MKAKVGKYGMQDRGGNYLHVLRETSMEATLVKLGFIANSKDAVKFEKKLVQVRYCLGIS